MSIGVCRTTDWKIKSEANDTLSSAQNAACCPSSAGRASPHPVSIYDLAINSAAAGRKRGAHATCTKCDTSSARTLEEFGGDENGGQEKSSNERSAHRGREWVLLTSSLQEGQRRHPPCSRVGGRRGTADFHPLAVRINCGTLRKKYLSHVSR
jgi:hypothetical protein